MQKRLVFAVLLSILVLFAYNVIIVPRISPRPQPAPEPAQQAQRQEAKPAPPIPAPAPPEREPVKPEAPPAIVAQPPEAEKEPAAVAPEVVPIIGCQAKEVTLQNGELEVIFDSRGAVVKQATLQAFKDPRKFKGPGFDKPLALVSPEYSQPAMVLTDVAGKVPMDSCCYKVGKASESSIEFYQEFSNGLKVTKTYRFREPADSYGLEVSFRFELDGKVASSLKLACTLAVVQGISSEDSDQFGTDLEGLIAFRTGGGQSKVKRKPLRSIRDKPEVFKDVPLAWLGVQNRYFACALFPQSEQATHTATLTGIVVTGPGEGVVSRPAGAAGIANVACQLLAPELTLTGSEAQELDYTFFIGPKRSDVLARFNGLDELAHGGWLGGIKKVLLWLLRAFHKGVGNYGVAILMLTVLVKVLLFPMTRKQQISMQRMQQLKPKLQELQQRLKNDKQRLGQEQLKLYRQHGVNPMGGCLPLLFNIPVFISLFQALRSAIELRQAPFALWINDLSGPDRAWAFPGGASLPFLGSYLNILPLFMMAAMVIQQRMTPKPADAKAQEQQKMFKFMPYFFGVLFYKMPSGLVLYWLASTLLGIGEQYLIKKHLAGGPLLEPTVGKHRAIRDKRRS